MAQHSLVPSPHISYHIYVLLEKSLVLVKVLQEPGCVTSVRALQRDAGRSSLVATKQ